MKKRYAKVKITKGSLNLRQAPMGDIVGKLEKDEVVEIIGSRDHVTGCWLQVSTKSGLTGFSSGTFFEEIELNEMGKKTNKEDDQNIVDEKPEWLKIAEKEIGVKEIEGSEHNSRILEYHLSTFGSIDVTDELPWCASFVNWCIEKAGFKGTKTKKVVDWIGWGKELNFDERKPGAIVIFKFRGGGNHVAFLKNLEIKDFTSGKRVTCLGGNQGDQVKESNYLIEDIITIRWPENV